MISSEWNGLMDSVPLEVPIREPLIEYKIYRTAYMI